MILKSVLLGVVTAGMGGMIAFAYLIDDVPKTLSPKDVLTTARGLISATALLPKTLAHPVLRGHGKILVMIQSTELSTMPVRWKTQPAVGRHGTRLRLAYLHAQI